MHGHHFLLGMLLIAGLAATPGAGRAAESYATCAGYIDALPTTIATQGVWCLRHDLNTGITTGNAITVNTNNVTIDCNNFKIGGLAGGAGSQATGIGAWGKQNTTVRNCNIRGFNTGISLFGGAGHLVEDNRLDNNLSTGIFVVGDHNRVRGNAVYDTGGATGATTAYAIVAQADIDGNIVEGVSTAGTTDEVSGIDSLADGARIGANSIAGLALNGGGTAYGIRLGMGANQVISGNNISATAAATSGYGIYANGSNSFCTTNTIARFVVDIYSCQKYANGEH